MSSIIPCVWLVQVDKNYDVAQLEGFICEKFFDEDAQLTYCYAEIDHNVSEEIVLNNHFIFEEYGINYQDIELEFKNSINKQEYIDQIEEPLIKYRLQYNYKHLQNHSQRVGLNNQSNYSKDDVVGAKVLLTLNPQYHKGQDVVLTNKYLLKQSQIKPVEQVAAYLNLTSQYQNLIQDKQQLFSGFITRSENIPEAYYQNQAKIAFEQGHGEIIVGEEYKQQLSQVIIDDQKQSLILWLNYLEEQAYPNWYKEYVLEGLKKMGAYDKQRNRFSKRRKDYVGTFPELNREALAQVYDHLRAYHQEELTVQNIDKELLDLLKTGSFVRLYEYFLINTKGIIEWDKDETGGEWVMFKQSIKDIEGEKLARSLQGYNTGWCTAGISTAQAQLKTGDFYVYYSKNKLGIPSVPRIAVRMEDQQVAEVRGIEPNQNLEGTTTPIMKEKMKTLPGGEEYFVKTRHMESLTNIWDKYESGKKAWEVILNKEELRFLYEIDEEIQGFGYEKDPRIEIVQKNRRLMKRGQMREDLACCLDLKTENVVIGRITIHENKDLEKISYVHGDIVCAHSVKSLPENLKAHKLKLGSSDISELPNNLDIKTLDMRGHSIKFLPQDIKVKYISAKGSHLKKLPSNLEVEELDIRNTEELKSLPSGLKAKGIWANESQLKFLPEDLQVATLYISDTSIENVPKISGCKGIWAKNSQLKFLPNDLVLDALSVEGTPLKWLPKGLKSKSLYASYSQLNKLPKDLQVDILYINSTNVREIPAKFTSKAISARDSKLTKIGEGLTCDYLNIINTPIKRLPQNIKAKTLRISEAQISLLNKDGTYPGIEQIVIG